jgi:hypothetical protein
MQPKAVNEKHFGTCPNCKKYKGLWDETGICDDCDEETSDRLTQENLDQWQKQEEEEEESK